MCPRVSNVTDPGPDVMSGCGHSNAAAGLSTVDTAHNAATRWKPGQDEDKYILQPAGPV